MSTEAPARVRIRMYKVGFGDCILLSFEYGRAIDGRPERHMLIDFGTCHRSESGPDLNEVAELIKRHTDEQLDVLVVTHRHRDHLGGFGPDDTRAIIESLDPKLVMRPWTDDPKLHDDATGPKKQFVGWIDRGSDLVDQISRLDLARGLREMADEASSTIPNKREIEAVDELAGSKGVYLSYGQTAVLDGYIPGVGCDVLGPPTIDEWPAMRQQRYDDQDEFWRFRLDEGDLGVAAAGEVKRDQWNVVAGPNRLGPARWLLDRLHERSMERLLELSRRVDNAVNNTSLILLLRVGERRLLFPGDAQIENWEYVLKFDDDKARRASYRAELERVDVYKVGHHGSRNATPVTLFNLWCADGGPSPTFAMMSTEPKVHGRNGPHPVPKESLVRALSARMKLLRTDTLPADQQWLEVEVPAAPDKPIRQVAPKR